MAAKQQLHGFAKNPGGTNKIYLRGAGRDGRLRCVTLAALPSTAQRFSPNLLFPRTTRHRPPHKCRWQLLMDMLQIQQLPLKSSGILWRVWRVFRVWRVLQVVGVGRNSTKFPFAVVCAT